MSKPTQPQRPMRLALGPLTYFWPRQAVLDFYEQAARWPVDVVYLGETVCSRRRELKPSDWADIAEKMAAAGKEAVLSTYELIETDADLRVMRQVVENGRHKGSQTEYPQQIFTKIGKTGDLEQQQSDKTKRRPWQRQDRPQKTYYQECHSQNQQHEIQPHFF